MFLGEYSHSIDAKGRLAVPVKFRGALADGAVVTRGLDQCLFIYPKKEWEQLATKIAALPLGQKSARAFARMTLAGAMEASVDKQGRIILPGYLRDYASITSNVVVAGIYNRVEVWDEKLWKTYRTEAEQVGEEHAEELSNLGV